MDFALSPEQESIQELMRQVLAGRRSPALDFDESRSHVEADLWAVLTEELGLPGLIVPDEFGGVGLGMVEAALVLEETGYGLVDAPFLASCVIATNTLVNAPRTTPQDRVLRELAAAEALATVVLPTTPAGVQWARLRADGQADAWRVEGVAESVLDGSTADYFLVFAETAGGLATFLVDARQELVDRAQTPTLDVTRDQARVVFSGASAALIAAPIDTVELLEVTRDTAAVAVAAESAGGVRRCLDDATKHAVTRFQFGKPIGSFQVIRHMCADLLIASEAVSVASRHAAWSLAERAPDARVSVSLAKAYCSTAYGQAAKANLQLHGGLGFTWEHTAHLHLKRALNAQSVLGGVDEHYSRALALIIAGSSGSVR